jgi:uncharacterized protein
LAANVRFDTKPTSAAITPTHDLTDAQRKWVCVRDACGSDAGCLAHVYQARINELCRHSMLWRSESHSDESKRPRRRIARGLFGLFISDWLSSFGKAPGSLRAQPRIDVFSHLVLREAVSFLDDALKLVATTGDPVEVIVSEIAPFLLHAAFQLFPVSFNAIPVHKYLLCHLTRQDTARGYTR